MNKKQWILAYRMYRICSRQAQAFNWDEPDFPIKYPQVSPWNPRYPNVVMNTKTNYRFTVKEWKGKCGGPEELPTHRPPLIEWMDDSDALYSRWIGWYILLATQMEAFEMAYDAIVKEKEKV